MDESTAIRVEVEGLPALLVSGDICEPEPEVGIWSHVCYELDWCAAEGDLTPEQEIACVERSADIERRYIDTVKEREWQARLDDEAAEIEQRNNGAW
jgi:hypothetical protein